MKKLHLIPLLIFLFASVAVAQKGNNGKGNNGNGNGNGNDKETGRTNLILPHGFIGLNTLNPSERLEVIGNVRVSQTVFANDIDVIGLTATSITVREDINVGRNAIINGNVGIGVPNPTERLEVSGNLRVSQGIFSNTLETNTLTGGNGTFTEDLSVDQNFKVAGLTGLGITNPTERLEVEGNMKVTNAIYSSSIETQTFTSDNGTFNQNLNVIQDFTVSGNTGLGVTNPSERLDVSGNIRTTNDLISDGLNINSGEVSGDFSIGNALNVAGNTGMGVAAPTERLEVEGNAMISQKIMSDEVEANSATFSSNVGIGNGLTVDGNTGLGVTTPTERLDVDGNVKATGSLLSDGMNIEYGEVNTDFSIGNALVVNGNTGLGIAAPTERLDVDGNVKVSNTLFADAIESSSFTVENTTINNQLTVGGNAIVNGRIGLGVATPTVKLDVDGNIKASGNITANNINANEGTYSNLSSTGILSVSGNSNLTGNVTTNAITINGAMEVKNNANIVGNLGIGIGTPEATLHVAGDGKFDGNITAVKLIVEELEVANMDFGSGSSGGDMTFNENLFVDGSVGIGSEQIDGYKLSVNGKIRASDDIKVYPASEWADYVFNEDYELKSLDEVESFIRDNKRLAGMPSTKEVEEAGIELGAMDAKLLEKVEELTLYMIDLKNQNEELRSEVEKLKNSIKK